ncbi:hypothetical protein [Flavilitoribacter nigricans]|uniref:Uncharacterized protein n=1 Tax=Flavilitoribacter nigricans (strain ATCC 23147 / DSM 23189 / NBRC 102662 / NCIMB 1420 / SS-2) TaxID=1122177 RepID=A0A2D0NEZ6_FLAN2|nr:hypothetical protein [Flavilitoribacter nigricans]PHN06978.1 hypothetical protein CRP01_08435 [Flavilitoribacter nigricans DSM 23189 = NBRC 102662]
MELSNHHANTLLLDIHQDIEEYADAFATKVLDEKNLDFLTYPPNCGFTDRERAELQKLAGNDDLKNAFRKLLADHAAGIVFNILNLFDGTGFPKNDEDEWTGIKLVDEEPVESATPVDDWLHDKFYETYWDWKAIRGHKGWQLDTETSSDQVD